MIVLYDEPMKLHTTMRTGGAAKKFYKVTTKEEIIDIIDECEKNNENYYIVGNGSNLLVSDKGVDGSVIQIGKEMSAITIVSEDDSTDSVFIYAEAGAMLSQIASKAKEESLTGFEFASGIPGTLGGAVVMNAGAYNGEMKDIVRYVDLMIINKSDDEKKETRIDIVRLSNEEMKFDYRYSIANEKEVIVLGALIELKKGDKEAIVARMEELKAKRIEKQPLEYPSAGSTFKRPKDNFAGKLIMDSGLAGFTVGGAMVSTKHCGFVINFDNATSDDVYQLIGRVSDIVCEKYNVRLEPEVKMLGEF